MANDKQVATAVKRLAAKFAGRAGYVSTGTGKNKTSPGTVFVHSEWKAQTWVADVKTSGKAVGDPVPDCAIKVRKTARKLWDRDAILALCKFGACENGRYALNNVEFEFGADGECRATATDGRKLASIVTWDQSRHGNPDKSPTIFHISTDALRFLVDLHFKLDKYRMEFAHVQIGKQHGLAIYSGPALSIIWQGDGAYPDWRVVIPENKHSIEMGSEFFNLIEMVGRVSSVESQAVRLDFSGTGMAACGRSANPVKVEATGAITAKRSKDAPELKIGLDPDYIGITRELMQALRPHSFNGVHFTYTCKETGVILKATKNDPNLFLVMPIDV